MRRSAGLEGVRCLQALQRGCGPAGQGLPAHAWLEKDLTKDSLHCSAERLPSPRREGGVSVQERSLWA